MPAFRKKQVRRKPIKKRVGKKRYLAKIQRGFSPSIHSFKRSISQIVQLNTASLPSGWSSSGNNLYKNWAFALSSLGTYTDFTDLFKYYRIKGARVQMYFSNTTSSVAQGGGAADFEYANSQVLMHIDTNRDGADLASSGLEETYLNSQTAKKRLCLNSTGKPIDLYMSLRQASMINGTGPTSTDYATIKPKWISTTEPGCPHYGFKTMLQKVDGTTFANLSSNHQYVKIITTLYIQCKKVE